MIGLYLPYAEKLPAELVTLIIIFLIFLSSFRVNYADLSVLHSFLTVKFFVGRFILLPISVYYAACLLTPDYADSALLFTLLPAGVSVPAFTSIIGGNVSLALGLVVLTTFAAPFLIPLFLQLLMGSDISLDTSVLFYNLSFLIFFPVFLSFGVKKLPKVTGFFDSYNKLFSVLLVGLLMVVVIAQRRNDFFSGFEVLVQSLLVSFVLFVIYYIVGWLLGGGTNFKERLTLSVTSGVNNNALGISIAFLHFSDIVGIFMVVSELSWLISLVVFKLVVSRKRPKRSDMELFP